MERYQTGNVWARSRRSLHLQIENTGSQPLGSAFFKLPNLVCGRSEGLQSAIYVKCRFRPNPDLHRG
ncbi:MAG: hypothetical protein ACI85V_001543 [bacterium]|jgi:hypothetical protein